MTRITLPRTTTNGETAAVVRQAQRLYTLADSLVIRAEHLRDAAEDLIASAHIDVHLWSEECDIPTRRPLGSHHE